MPRSNVATGNPSDEQTGRQGGGGALSTLMSVPGLSPSPRGSYAVYRQMRSHPTIALARAVVMSPIIAGSWSFEAQDNVQDRRVAFIQEQIDPIRNHIVSEMLRALDMGWQGFEKVFERRDGLRLKRLKPLLPDITHIDVEQQTGRFAGFKQGSVTLPLEKSLLYTYDREGDNHHGRSRLENVRTTWSAWHDAQDAAARYDRKVAGVIPVVHYPKGSSYDTNSKLVENHTLAQRLIDSLAGGKGVAIENQFLNFTDDRDAAEKNERRQWLIDLLEDKGPRQPGFKDRLTYLDSLLFRGILRPERVALEGQHGTKAEAGEHADLALTDGELLHQEIVEVINWHLIDQLLVLNFGEDARGSVFITPAPLRDRKQALMVDLITKWAENPDGREDLRLWLDFDAVLDLAELPKADEVVSTRRDDDDEGNENEPPDPSQFSGPMAEQMRRLMAQARGADT